MRCTIMTFQINSLLVFLNKNYYPPVQEKMYKITECSSLCLCNFFIFKDAINALLQSLYHSVKSNK